MMVSLLARGEGPGDSTSVGGERPFGESRDEDGCNEYGEDDGLSTSGDRVVAEGMFRAAG